MVNSVKVIVFGFAMILCQCSCLAQTNPADSIKVDSIWHQGVKQLVKHRVNGLALNTDSALNYFLYSLKVIDSLRLPPGFTYEAWLRVGETYFEVKKVDSGLSYFMKVVDAYQKAGDKKREARTWLRLATKIKYAGNTDARIPGFLDKALDLSQQIHDTKKEMETYQEQGAYYELVNDYGKAERSFLKALKIAETTNSANIVYIFHALCELYRTEGKLNKSLFYGLQSIKAAETTRDKDMKWYLPYCYGLVSALYDDLGKLELAMSEARLAVASGLAQGDTQIAYVHENNIVSIFIELNKFDDAIVTAREFIKKYPPDNNIEKGIAEEMMGQYYEAIKESDLAEQHYLKMFAFYNASGTMAVAIWTNWSFTRLAGFYIQQKRYGDAEKYMKLLDKRPEKHDLPFSSLIEDELFYFKIDSAKGNLLSAIRHYQKYKVLNDSAFNLAQIEEREEMQAKYETAKKEKDIAFLTKDSQVQHTMVGQANKARNLILAVAVLLIILVAVLYKSYRLNRKRNKILNQLVTEKDILLTEKEWLLKEIHHRVKNNLQIVIGLLQQQSVYIDNDTALTAIRNSENRMYSIALIHQRLYQSDTLGLIFMPEYINELIGNLKDSFGGNNRVNFEKDLDEIYLDVSQAIPVGLILNEGITNAIKYAHPDMEGGGIFVSFRRVGDEQVQLTIKDDGVGLPPDFDPDEIDSLGMNLMRGLSKQLGGTFELDQNGGVTITTTFKIENLLGTQPSPGKSGKQVSASAM
jgi:two-component sensor histidine kinase